MGAAADPLISVITPVYNGEAYLGECIASVLGQTHSNFEYIICNNHSKDRSLEIAQSYAARDPRIRVVQPPTFLPQSSNFNYALTQISDSSRYCKMIFCDDWLFPECLERMSAVAEANPNVAMVSAYRLIETQSGNFGLPPQKTVISGRDACRLHLLDGVFLFGTPTAVMYRAEIVRSRAPAFYPPDRVFFDTDVAFQILENRDFGFVHQVLTFSRYQPGSITADIAAFNVEVVDRLMVLKNYGETYLTAEELKARETQVKRYFYEVLGRQWWRDRLGKKSDRFWEYQRRCLKTIGDDIRPESVAMGAALALLKTLASPLELTRSLRGSK